jgi:pentatricopeptide repeat protein
VYRALIRRFCKIEKIDCAQRVLGLMKDKGIFGDSVIYTSLAYGYWKVGKVNVTSDILDEMYKKRLMITLKIYRSFNASYASDNSILSLFWNHVLERRLMSKNILKDMQ